ncbi:hypothetical protein EMPS_00449 [Entomortierella parvispora]|uniref:PAS domain-containing protein n=1 Tax=Entomortierella parvispora TaxID=205924 RepID=A0A9P3H0Z1_9FUNG|nr:hypothetical protein EMPS_00449 [Entomortierella parvispora]
MPKKTGLVNSKASVGPSSTTSASFPQTPSNETIPNNLQQDRPSSFASHPEPERPSSSLSYRTSQPSVPSYQGGRPLSLHSEPSLPSERQDQFYYSSTSQVKRPQEVYSGPSGLPLATLFLTMDLICARVSDESQAMWGYHPHDISHKSLYSIVANEDQGKMRDLLRMIRDAVFSAASSNGSQHVSHISFLDSSSPVFYQNRPGIMSSSAPGSSEYTDVIRICHADGGSDLFSVRMYVGGGLGTDLSRGLSIEHAYVVCVMSRHSPPPLYNDRPRPTERQSMDETRTGLYSSDTQASSNHGVSYLDSSYAPKRLSQPHPQQQQQPTLAQRYSTMEPISGAESRKISLPPIFTGGPTSSSANSPAFPSPSTLSPLHSGGASQNRFPLSYGMSATSSSPSSSTPSSSSSLSYTVSLGKPSTHSGSVPPMRTGPLHQARWLYDSEPLGGSGHSSHNSPTSRLPTLFADPFRTLSAPMGGFGVSKYLNRSEPSPAFGSLRRHHLPLPSPTPLQQASQSSRQDLVMRTPKSLQRDLSSSAFGASFASRSPPQSMKRPLADMADSHDRNRDIDNRHQDHHHLQHHQTLRPTSSLTSVLLSSSNSTSRPAQAPMSPSLSSTSGATASASASYQSSIKLELQSMPPDHPNVENSATGVCPIVHGQQQRERLLQQQQLQALLQTRGVERGENSSTEAGIDAGEETKPPCPWAKMSEQWKDRDRCPATGRSGMDAERPKDAIHQVLGQRERDSVVEGAMPAELGGGSLYFDHEGSRSPSSHRESLSPGSSLGSQSHQYQHQQQPRYGGLETNGGQYNPPDEVTSSRHHHRHHTSSGAVNPFSTGPSSPTLSEKSSSSSYGRSGSALRRTSSVGRSSYISRSKTTTGPVTCLSGACGSVCRCSIEDEETRAVKAIEAARKRMSVHSLLC